MNKERLKKIAYYLRFGTWIRNYRTSTELSKTINTLLDDPNTEIKKLSDYTTSVGGLILWTSNFPYAYGRVSDALAANCVALVYLDPRSKEWDAVKANIDSQERMRERYKGCMPDRETVFRLREAVYKATSHDP